MRLTSVCGLFMLCLHFYFVEAENSFDGTSTHYVRRRETKPKYDYVIATRMTVSPSWYLNVGDTVEINCTSHFDNGNYSDKMDLQLVWTKMSPGDRTKKVLVKQRASEKISYVLGPVTHEHQGVYTCEDDGSYPEVYVHDWHQMIWVADASHRASMDLISHNRTVFFHNENFTVSCQLPDDDPTWRIMRHNRWLGFIKECANQVSSGRSLSCTILTGHPWTDELYWCENQAGERSNALNISSTVVTISMEMSPLPVLEGEDVKLRCIHRNRTTKEISSNFGAFFYKNDRVKWHDEHGEITLKAVTKDDEGLYKCRHEKEGDTHNSWLTVKARPNGDQKEKADVIETP